MAALRVGRGLPATTGAGLRIGHPGEGRHDVRADERSREARGAAPRFLVGELAVHVAGRSPDELLFTGERGAVMRSQTFQRAALTRTAEALKIPGFHPHELRHTAASLAIASGADVKVVQQMLGHKSATMTLDLYGHLFGDRLDVVADAMDSARALSAFWCVPIVYHE